MTITTKRFALDLHSGEVIDAKGYVCAGQNLADLDSRAHLITRALIKGLKAHVRTSQNRHTINAIALLRNPKTVREALQECVRRELFATNCSAVPDQVLQWHYRANVGSSGFLV